MLDVLQKFNQFHNVVIFTTRLLHCQFATLRAFPHIYNITDENALSDETMQACVNIASIGIFL